MLQREGRDRVNRNRQRARDRNRESLPTPDYQPTIDHKDIWKRITIEGSDGSKAVIMLYMAYDRVNSWNMKDGDLTLMDEKNPRKPKRIGSNRAGVYIGTKLGCYGRFDG